MNPKKQPPTRTPKPLKSSESGDFQIDVDEALIDDKHPKDTIQGGPPEKKRPNA